MLRTMLRWCGIIIVYGVAWSLVSWAGLSVSWSFTAGWVASAIAGRLIEFIPDISLRIKKSAIN